jgi:hypothetical protein
VVRFDRGRQRDDVAQCRQGGTVGMGQEARFKAKMLAPYPHPDNWAEFGKPWPRIFCRVCGEVLVEPPGWEPESPRRATWVWRVIATARSSVDELPRTTPVRFDREVSRLRRGSIRNHTAGARCRTADDKRVAPTFHQRIFRIYSHASIFRSERMTSFDRAHSFRSPNA